MSISVVPFAPSHVEPIVALSLRAWAPVFAKLEPAVQPYVYRAFYPHGWQVRQEADVRALLAAEGHHVQVAVDGDAVRGWVGLRLHPEDRMGEIHILAVDPDHQRRGVALALMEHAFAELRAAGMAMVMVETGDDPGHAPSRATYERAGFERWPVARYFREL
jgi:GNAT superfamily N-acetyltransferase